MDKLYKILEKSGIPLSLSYRNRLRCTRYFMQRNYKKILVIPFLAKLIRNPPY